MREIWGPAWFATALCVITLVSMVFSRHQTPAIAFFCFLPVVFMQMARTTQALEERVEELERERDGAPPN